MPVRLPVPPPPAGPNVQNVVTSSLHSMSMASILPAFNNERVLLDYVRSFYVPAAKQGRAAASDGFRAARDLAADLRDDAAADDALSRLRGVTIADADQRGRYTDLESALARRSAAALAVAGDVDTALRNLAQARSWLPDDHRLQLQQAELLLDAGRSGEAVQRYAELHAQPPQDAALQLGYARALRKAGRAREARREIDALAQHMPATDDDLRLDVAAEYRALGLPDAAARLYADVQRTASASDAWSPPSTLSLRK